MQSLPTRELELLEIGSQKEVSVDVIVDEGVATTQVDDARVIYEMPKLQDEHKRRYVTYQVHVAALKAFVTAVGPQNIEYVHE